MIFFCFSANVLAYELKLLPGRSAPKPSAVLNVVFCPLNYQRQDDFLKDAAMMMRRLSETKPFEEFAQAIGAYTVTLSAKEVAAIFKRVQDFPPLKVRQDFLDSISSRLGSDYKLVIVDALSSSFCAELSSIDKMSLIVLGKARYKGTNSFAKGFLHELGHSLGLRDESSGAEAKHSPVGYPNCARNREEAQEWWGDLTGKAAYVDYINGCCGNADYFRPTIASLMNDTEKAEDFGPVNQRYLKKTLSAQEGRPSSR
ncbi:MAG TPA: hypothetical protein PLL75_05550 [Candidatus Omnitrophota bacterium]|nr:hypothetical protein [Candidatus Omnitrophota bacterium]HPS37172.1 hypothetical protein [Candidatus Omnitrophota bacterium]